MSHIIFLWVRYSDIRSPRRNLRQLRRIRRTPVGQVLRLRVPEDPRRRDLFRGPDGLDRFHTDDIRNNPHPPQVVLTDFSVFNESASFKQAFRPVLDAPRIEAGTRTGYRNRRNQNPAAKHGQGRFVIQRGPSDIDFRGLTYGTLCLVLRNRFEKEIQTYQPDIKKDFHEELARLKKEKKSLQGLVNHLSGKMAEYQLFISKSVRRVRSNPITYKSWGYFRLSKYPHLLRKQAVFFLTFSRPEFIPFIYLKSPE